MVNIIKNFFKPEPVVYVISGGNKSPYWGNPEDMITWRPAPGPSDPANYGSFLDAV